MKWFVAIVGLLLAALILDSGLLAYVTYVLFSLLLIGGFLAKGWMGNLKAKRTCFLIRAGATEKEQREATSDDITAEVGDTILVRVRIENPDWLPVPWLLLEDMVPAAALETRSPRLKLKGKRAAIVMLASKGEAILRYKLECLTRGYYQLGPMVVENGDLWGLYRRYKLMTAPEYLLVYPRIITLEGYELASRRPIGDVQITHRLYEDPTRLAGVRAYEPGDPMNRVHWKATARTGELHCKITDPSTLSGATLVMDFHHSGYHNRGEPVRSELAVTATASLANAVLETGQQVGLVTNARDAADRLRLETWQAEQETRSSAHHTAEMKERSERLEPLRVDTQRGVEQLQRIREVLARAELTDGLTFAQLLTESVSRLPRDATVLAVVAEVTIETALTLGSLRRRGFAVTVVLILMEDEPLEKAHGRLLAEGIRDIRHLRSEEELPWLCQSQVQRSSAYRLSSL